MRHTIAVLSALSVLSVSHAWANTYYWCRDLYNYYPIIKSCPAGWQQIDVPALVGSGPFPPPNIAPPPEYVESERRRKAEAEAAAEEEKAQAARTAAEQAALVATANQQYAERKASEQAEQAAYLKRMNDYSLRGEDKGYQPISFFNFDLNSDRLVSTQKKISMAGYYAKVGDNYQFYESRSNTQRASQYGQFVSGITMIADDAPPELRESFLHCDNAVITHFMGCSSILLGHAAMCTSTTSMTAADVPCFVIEDGWSGLD